MRNKFAAGSSALALIAIAVVGFMLAGPAVGGSKATQVTDINVIGMEFTFQLSATSAPAGTINFHFVNRGTVEHDFAIAGRKTPTVAPGGSATLTVTLSAGTYPFLCTIGEHADFGMQGTFTVTGAGGTTVITTGGTTIVVTNPPPPPPKVTATVRATESEWKIKLTNTKGKPVSSVKRGRIKFVVKNVGKLPHNFVIAKQQTLVLKPKKSFTLTVTLKKGKYRYICSITGHAALGMKGVLKVT